MKFPDIPVNAWRADASGLYVGGLIIELRSACMACCCCCCSRFGSVVIVGLYVMCCITGSVYVGVGM